MGNPDYRFYVHPQTDGQPDGQQIVRNGKFRIVIGPTAALAEYIGAGARGMARATGSKYGIQTETVLGRTVEVYWFRSELSAQMHVEDLPKADFPLGATVEVMSVPLLCAGLRIGQRGTVIELRSTHPNTRVIVTDTGRYIVNVSHLKQLIPEVTHG